MISYYLLRCAILVGIGLLIYAQTFRFDFVFDDHIFIVTNPYIKNWENFHLIWHAFPLTRLVGMFSFLVNYHFNHLHPFGYHLFNFTVHLVGAVLVWALSDLLFKITKFFSKNNKLSKELPFIIALLFLVHPGQIQAVTYITQRFESMATVFYLGAIYAYLRARLSTQKGPQIALFILACLLTLLGIMTKEVVITLPVMILMLEWILFPKKDNKKIYLILAVGGVLLYLLFTKLVYTDWRIFLRSVPSESHDGDMLTPGSYFLTQMRVFLTFLRLLILPTHQNLDYDYPASSGILHPPLTLVGLGVIGLFIFLVIRWRHQFPLIALGLVWMLVTFSINLAPRANVIFEHKLYLISFGFFLTAVVLASLLIKDRSTLIKILTCSIAVLAVVSFQRNKVWANELLLWQDSLKNSPNKARVNASLGRVYGSSGRHDEAIYYFSRAIAISPDNITYENRGVTYSLQGRKTEALADLNKSIDMDPAYPLTYAKRAWVYYEMNDLKAAFADLERAIQLDPYFVDPYIERGSIWLAQGNHDKALNDFQKALSIDPLNYELYLRVGGIHHFQGRYDLALEYFTKALGLEPSSVQAAKYKLDCLEKLRQK